MSEAGKSLVRALIKFYRYLISPLFPSSCRFYPSCSAYMLEAVECHGAAKGMTMGVKRLLRCHPWHKGPMCDPVPASIDWATLIGYKGRENLHGQDCGCGHRKEKD